MEGLSKKNVRLGKSVISYKLNETTERKKGTRGSFSGKKKDCKKGASPAGFSDGGKERRTDWEPKPLGDQNSRGENAGKTVRALVEKKASQAEKIRGEGGSLVPLWGKGE